MTAVPGCCEPAVPPAPVPVENRPGLSAIAYRIGTYARFREAMLQAIARTPALAALTTRQGDDYAITLMQLWAALADVLTFYQERYANEAFLRTATRRESVARLARLIGYALRPGAAALARLAFTVEEGRTVQVPVGLRVQSVPGQDETPQVFETLEAITADARLNRLRVYPKPTEAVNSLARERNDVILDRTEGPALAASLSPGDRVVLFNSETTAPVEEMEIAAVRLEDDRVLLAWTAPIREGDWTPDTQAFKFGRTFRLFGHDAPAAFMNPLTDDDSNVTGWKREQLGGDDYGYPRNIPEGAHPQDGATSRGGQTKSAVSPGPNDARDIAQQSKQSPLLCLDARYEGLVPGQQLLVANAGPDGFTSLVTITKVDRVRDYLGPLADTVTRVHVDPLVREMADRRAVLIYELLGSQLTFWGSRYAPTLSGDTVYLPGRRVAAAEGDGVEVGRTIDGGAFRPGVILRPKELDVGRHILLSDANGRPVLGRLKAVPTITPPDAHGFCHLVLRLDVAATVSLETASAVLLGNVALASHGETVRDEVVGDGDASATFQRLTLKKKPLTYVPSARPEGVESSLRVTVDGVRWTEVPALSGQAPAAQVYSAATADDGSTGLQFGDGTEGATLPTGQGNVTATYRVGLGLAGRIRANALTTAMDRPPGLAGVTNPLPAEGGADPETIALARRNAPRSVRTFNRVISLRDFEDLVTASGEVAKAQATMIWDGLARAVHLTVAGQQGGVFTDEGLRRLGAALAAGRDPNHRLRLDNYARAPIALRATVGVAPTYVRTEVVAAARTAILEALAFEVFHLGQPVHLSDVYRVLQEVPGVLSVDVDVLQFKQPAGMNPGDFQAYLDARGVTRTPNGSPEAVQGHLRIYPARPDPARAGRVLPAELAWIDSPTQDVVITATGGLEG